MEILSIIPARGGSTEIPMKNIVNLNKKHLLNYTVTASLNSKYVTRTIVSTDHNKIADIAKKLKVEVIKRPKNLSGNKIRIEPTIQHVLSKLEKTEGYKPDIILLLQNTSPLRNSKHIDESIKLFKKRKFDSLFSGYKSHSLFWKASKNFAIPLNYKPNNRPNRQQMNDQFIENGAIFVFTYEAFRKNKCRLSGKIGIYEMSEFLSIQIDSLNDLFLIEQILKKGEKF